MRHWRELLSVAAVVATMLFAVGYSYYSDSRASLETTAALRTPAVPRLEEDVGLKTSEGFTPLIRKGSPLPAEFAENFSTGEDNQSQVEVRLFATGSDRFPRGLGIFQINGIEPALRGVPRIRVVLRIDESGMVEIAARHLATGITQNIQLGRVRVSVE